MVRLGKDGNKINPLVPVDLVIDHSVQVIICIYERLMSVESQVPTLKTKKSNSIETMRDLNSLNGDKMHLKISK